MIFGQLDAIQVLKLLLVYLLNTAFLFMFQDIELSISHRFVTGALITGLPYYT